MRTAAPKGHTTPRLFTPELRELTPATSLGFECCTFLTDVLGWELRPWQRWLYIHALELDASGKGFRYDTILVLIARQNGKTRWLLGLVLWRLFVDMAVLVISTAQDLDKAEELLDEGAAYIEGDPELGPELVKYLQTNGKRKITLTGRRRWKAQTATRRGGRSMSADLAILDELREHQSWEAWSAIVPTTTAVARSQVVAVSNAGDKKSIVLRAVRDSAKRRIELGETAETKVGLFEWSVPDDVPHTDPTFWPYANPSLGYGITEEKLRGYLETGMPESEFRTEYLCQWVDTIEPGVFTPETWEALRDPASRRRPGAPVSIALDVSWDRKWAHLTVAAQREDGRWHIELVASRAGTAWVAGWFRERLAKFPEVVVQARGAPASSLIPELREVAEYDSEGNAVRQLEVIEWGGPDLAIASGQFFDVVEQGRLRHRGQPRLSTAAVLVKSKKSGDSWIFERANAAGDVAPVVSGVAALWRAMQPKEEELVSAYEDGEVVFA
ncbi:terminase [Rhodococcus sp. NPDC019627]|uniref:terminase n=1 Tax=unclassified Rhodococcus (in: high G+C Gram-positive bacteria) TaxID=192944 RepID=UPI0037A9DC27